MLETSGNAGKRTGARYILVLDVALDIYSLPGFECEESIGACPRPRKDVEDPRESHRHSQYPGLASPLPKCETSNMERKDVIGDGPAVARRKIPCEGLQQSRVRSRDGGVRAWWWSLPNRSSGDEAPQL